MKSLIFILILTLILGCTSGLTYRHENKYDIEINYNYYKEIDPYHYNYMDKKYQRDGNIYLFVESQFKNDTIIINVNNKLKYSDIITTESSTGIAKDYKIENIKNVNNIGISINNGKQAIIEIDTMNLFTIEFRDSTLRINILDHVPVYY